MRVRPLPRLSLNVLLLAAVAWPAGPLAAQGLFEQLFGFASPKPAAPAAQPLRGDGHTGVFAASPERMGSEPRSVEPAGTFRTVCVRMCDGSFVPISFATRRSNFQQDEAKCRATCGGDAQLFYHLNPGGAMDDAVDLNGRAYSRLPNAFRFRKARVEGCSCRPPPWSEAELARHQSYAAASATPPPSTMSQGRMASAAPGRAADADAARKMALASLGDAGGTARSKGAQAAEKMKKKSTAESRGVPFTPTSRPAKVVVAGGAQKAAPFPAGLFGGSNSGGMGLSGKPKYLWPGD